MTSGPMSGNWLRPVLLGPLPPPVHGAAVMHAAVAQDLARRGPVEVIDIGPGAGGPKAIRRLARALAAVAKLGLAARSGARCLYLTADDGYGVAYAVPALALARTLGMTIIVHHHSFRYIDRPTWPMRLLIALAGCTAHHLVLCPAMHRGLIDAYRRDLRATVVDNAALTVTEPGKIDRAHAARLRIGMLSNLSAAKGTLQFLACLDHAAQRGLPIDARLAGPSTEPEIAERITAARAKHGDRLIWYGPLYGVDKDRFWNDIDVFVFPTRYRSEAQPLVVLEAIARGIPVIARARGCLRDDIGPGGVVVPDSVDFTEAALTTLESWLHDPAKLRATGAAAAVHARDRLARGRSAWDGFCRDVLTR